MNQAIHAPEFPDHLQWLNTTTPLSLAKLKGHVVILDFWTYCCINCIHILPDLKYLEHKYADKPVMVIGVHAAKFANERDERNIQFAINRYEIEHPVVVDNKHQVWDAYAINSWPSFAIIDAEGYVRAKASGEGLREVLDEAIEKLLEEGEGKGILAKEPLKVVPEREAHENVLSFPGKITFDSDWTRMAISDSNHNQIVVGELTTPTTLKVTHRIGTGQAGMNDGGFDEATFDHPQGLCFAEGRLYVCDTESHVIREIDFESGQVSTVAGTGVQARGPLNGGDSLETDLNSPWDIVYDGASFYIAMAGSHQIAQLNLDHQVVEVFAGSGRENVVDAHRLDAQLAQPSGLSLVGPHLYFADSEVSAVRRVNMETDAVETLVGTGLFNFGHVDGDLDRALLQHCLGLHATDQSIYVADTYNHAIRRIDLHEEKIETLLMAESKESCRLGDRSCNVLPLFEPNDVFYLDNRLYIADTNNHLIRVFDFDKAELIDLEIS